MKPNRSLVNYLIDPLFQFRFAGVVVLILTLFVAVIGAYSFFSMNGLIEMLLELTEVPDSAKSLVTDEVSSFLYVLGAILAVFFLLTTGIVIIQTHRIAGAKYAIVRHVKTRLHEGDFQTEIKLRKNDYLKDIAEALNNLSSKLKGK